MFSSLSLLYTKVLEGGRLISNLDDLSKNPSLATNPTTAELYAERIRQDVNTVQDLVRLEIHNEEAAVNAQVLLHIQYTV